MNNLNLGCSIFKNKDYINVDSSKEVNPDVLWDLNNYPYPFENESFYHVNASHLLEHLDDPFKFMKEIHRILKPHGKILIRVPHFSRGFTHPEHKRGFDVSFPMYFNKKYKAFYQGTPFNLVDMRLVWFAQPHMKLVSLPKFQYYVGYFMGKFIDLFANISPRICSRFWCFYVGGFDEINFILEKV